MNTTVGPNPPMGGVIHQHLLVSCINSSTMQRTQTEARENYTPQSPGILKFAFLILKELRIGSSKFTRPFPFVPVINTFDFTAIFLFHNYSSSDPEIMAEIYSRQELSVLSQFRI